MKHILENMWPTRVLLMDEGAGLSFCFDLVLIMQKWIVVSSEGLEITSYICQYLQFQLMSCRKGVGKCTSQHQQPYSGFVEYKHMGSVVSKDIWRNIYI